MVVSFCKKYKTDFCFLLKMRKSKKMEKFCAKALDKYRRLFYDNTRNRHRPDYNAKKGDEDHP